LGRRATVLTLVLPAREGGGAAAAASSSSCSTSAASKAAFARLSRVDLTSTPSLQRRCGVCENRPIIHIWGCISCLLLISSETLGDKLSQRNRIAALCHAAVRDEISQQHVSARLTLTIGLRSYSGCTDNKLPPMTCSRLLLQLTCLSLHGSLMHI